MNQPSPGTVESLYTIYSSVLSVVREFARARGIHEMLPAPAAPSFESERAETYYFGSEDDPAMILPGSNTFQKQLASQYLGSVYAFAACYRKPGADELAPALHLDVFHQIEFELVDTSIDGAMALGSELLAGIVDAVPAGLTAVPPSDFVDLRRIDLLGLAGAPQTMAEYDAWATKLSADVEQPVWVLHTPQTRRRRFNCIASSSLTESFDLILPHNHGELLSGGLRDKSQLAEFWPRESIDLDATTCGFGIGLERLVSFLVGARGLADIVLPHLRTAWN